MASKNICGADDALANIHVIRERLTEAQDTIHRLKIEIINIPSWCEIDSVNMLVEKFAASTKGFDVMVDYVQKLIDFLNMYIENKRLDENSRELVKLMNSQKIEF